MDRKEHLMKALAKIGIHSEEEVKKAKVKPIDISLMVSKPEQSAPKKEAVM